MKKIFLFSFFMGSLQASLNQTNDLSPVFVDQQLPFSISITQDTFTIPGGIHSGAFGDYQGQFLFIAGRTNGLHGFDNTIPNNNFPPSQQNSTVFVIDPNKKTVKSRSLLDRSSGLTRQQIDSLSVTSPQSYQSGTTLYMTGGYGIDTATGTFSTKDTLTAIDIPGLMKWVTADPNSLTSASKYIRQISNPMFQVTGGAMYPGSNGTTLLIFGQNFTGYYTQTSNGSYTQQVRKFRILDFGGSLNVVAEESSPVNGNYRRRDLNVVPSIRMVNGRKIPEYVAFSGVFTEASGVWTVPVHISVDGTPVMADPNNATTFKQAMNNYVSPHAPLLDRHGIMYTILFGGLTYGYFDNGQFVTDPEIPFTNQITAIKRNQNGIYQQFLLPVEYPTIISTQSNPGNTLLFGAGGKFMPALNISTHPNGVFDLTKITQRTLLGYIIGGIQSTFINTSSPSDSAASPYIFKVYITPNAG